ncbi:TolC family protein [Candidatus Poribacteria bacterium]|nr:TolC family protein [Candidatus Poribacteria bacterium]
MRVYSTLFIFFIIFGSVIGAISVPFAQEASSVIQEKSAVHEATPELAKEQQSEREERINLDKLIAEALKNNPELQAARYSWEAAKARIPQARAFEDPQFNMMFYSVPGGNGNSIEPNTSFYRISQMFPFPGKRGLREKIAEKSAEQAWEFYKAKELEIINKVKLIFYDLFMAHKSIQINQENVELSRYFLKVAETRYAIGQASQQDVLKAQVELSRLLNEEVTLRGELETVQAQLNILLNRAPQAPLGMPEDFTIPPVIKNEAIEENSSSFLFDQTFSFPKRKSLVEEFQQLALKNRPELNMTESAIEQGKAMRALAKRNYFPDIMGMIERMPEQKGSGSWDVMLTINIPLFFRDKYDSAVKEAEASIKASEASYETVRNQVLFEVKDLLVKVQTAERLENLYRTTLIPQAEQSLKAAEVGYESGRVDFLSLIESQRALQDFRLDYYRAFTNLAKTIAQLERAVGGAWGQK